MTLRDISMDEKRGALRRVLCRERRRRQPPKVSGPLAAPVPQTEPRGSSPKGCDQAVTKPPNPSSPPHRTAGATDRSIACRPPQRVSHRACAMAASRRVSDSTPQLHRKISPIYGRQRSPRPAAGSVPRTKGAKRPKVSGPLAAATQRRFSRRRRNRAALNHRPPRALHSGGKSEVFGERAAGLRSTGFHGGVSTFTPMA